MAQLNHILFIDTSTIPPYLKDIDQKGTIYQSGLGQSWWYIFYGRKWYRDSRWLPINKIQIYKQFIENKKKRIIWNVTSPPFENDFIYQYKHICLTIVLVTKCPSKHCVSDEMITFLTYHIFHHIIFMKILYKQNNSARSCNNNFLNHKYLIFFPLNTV